MKYWAFEMKEGNDKLISCNDIENVYLLGQHQQYNPSTGQIIDTVASIKTEVITSTNPEENKKLKSKGRKVKNKVPVRHEIRSGGKTTIAHIPVSAEQRYANKKARETAEGKLVQIKDGGYHYDFLVVRHVDGSLFLLREEHTHNEYWGKWKMKSDEWILWSDNYAPKGKKGTPHEHHRSSCCYAPNRRRLANKPYCLDCIDDNKTQRTNRRINNGGPEANLIFDKNGELTTAWTEANLDRLREQEDNE